MLGQGHHVHVAFDNDGGLRIADRAPRKEQAVELATLLEQRRFWRVQILRLALAQHAPAEADHVSTIVLNREHHAVTESIIAFSLLVDDQAAFDQRADAVIVERCFQALPIVRRITQAKTFGDFTQ